MTKHAKILLPFAAFALALAFLFPMKVQAASLPFSVTPVVSHLQRDKSESYYDVIVKPGTSTKLQAKLVNNTNKAITVNAKVATAQTNDSGMVDYTDRKTVDSTLKTKLTAILTGAKKVTIPAKGTVTYTATLAMPANHGAGITAGALIFSPQTTSKTKSSANFAVKNQYQYSIAVVTRSVDSTWLPQLAVGKTKITQSEYKNVIALPLHNTSATFLNQLRVEAKATNETTGKQYKRTVANMQMAPNSHFDYMLQLPKTADAGTYKVTAVAYYVQDTNGAYRAADGTRYQYRKRLKQTVVLTKKQAKQMNKTLQATKGGLPWFVYAVIGVIAVLVITVVGLVVFIIRRKK